MNFIYKTVFFVKNDFCRLLSPRDLVATWVASFSLVSQVARAQIAAIRMASDPEGRFIARTQLIGNRYTRGFSSDRIRETF